MNSQNTAIQKTNAPQQGLSLVKADERNSLARLNMRELKELATVFMESGSFPDIKSAAQAQVKIIAGAELGFSPIVSMTGIHFFQGKVEFSSTLKASLIKASGKYEYKILQHTRELCEVAFFQKVGNELRSLGVPVKYTMEDARIAGLAGKDNWKKSPMDMLFAACIRQGQRRHCADVLRGLGPEADSEATEEIDTSAMDDATAQNVTVEGSVVETVDESTGEVIETPAASDTPLFSGKSTPESELTDLREAVENLLSVKIGDGQAEREEFLNGRDPEQMALGPLKKLHGDLAAM